MTPSSKRAITVDHSLDFSKKIFNFLCLKVDDTYLIPLFDSTRYITRRWHVDPELVGADLMTSKKQVAQYLKEHLADIMRIHPDISEEKIKEHFGFHAGINIAHRKAIDITFERWRKYVMRAVKNPFTIEQMMALGFNVAKKNGFTPLQTTEQLYHEVQLSYLFRENKFELWVNRKKWSSIPLWSKKEKPYKRSVTILDKGYALYSKVHKGYLKKSSNGRMRFEEGSPLSTIALDRATRFKNQEEVEHAASAFSLPKNDYTVVALNEPCYFFD